MNRYYFGNCAPCCTPTIIDAFASVNEDSANTLTIRFTPCEPTPLNGYLVQYRIHGATGAYTIVGPYTTSPIVIVTADPPGTQYEGYLYSDCGNGNITQVAFETVTNNCIYIDYNTQSIGYQVFVCAHSVLPVTSNVTIIVTVTTQYNSYIWTGTILIGNTSACHKISYGANPGDEALVSLVINSITPASDSTYNYIECD